MDEYIEKRTVLDAIDRLYDDYIDNPVLGALTTLKEEIEELPPTDVRLVINGSWIKEDTAANGVAYRCSICGTGGKIFKYNFCSKCGAYMKVDGDG